MTPFYAVIQRFGCSERYAFENIQYFRNEEDAIANIQQYVNNHCTSMEAAKIDDSEKSSFNIILKYDTYINQKLFVTFAIQRLAWS